MSTSFVFHGLRLQNEQFFEERRIHCTWFGKGSIVSTGKFEPSIHGLRCELSTTELPMNGHKSSVYQVQLVYKSIKCTQLSQNDKLWTISNKCFANIAANINISFHRFLFDKNVTTMGKNPECSKNILFVRKWVKILWRHTSGYYYWKSMKLVASINSHILVCIVLVLYMWENIKIGSVVACTNTPEWQKVVSIR